MSQHEARHCYAVLCEFITAGLLCVIGNDPGTCTCIKNPQPKVKIEELDHATEM